MDPAISISSSESLRVLVFTPDQGVRTQIEGAASGLSSISVHLAFAETYDQAFSLASRNDFDVYILSASLTKSTASEFIERAVEAGCRGNFVLLSDESSLDHDLAAIRENIVHCLDSGNINSGHLERTLAAILAEERSTAAMRYRLDFEKLIAAISSEFISLKISDLDEGIFNALRDLGAFSGADRSFIMQPNPEGKFWNMTYEWHAQGISAVKHLYSELDPNIAMPIFSKLEGGQVWHCSDVADMPPQTEQMRRLLEGRSVKAFIVVPILADSQLVGVLGFSSIRSKRSWSPEIIELLEHVAKMFLNLFERSNAEAALRDSELRYGTLLESLGEGVVVTDTEERILHVNSRMVELSGYSTEEIIGRKTYELMLDEPQREVLLSKTKRRLEGIVEQYELHLTRKDGSKFWAEIFASPLRNSKGEVIGTLGTVTNISERHALQEMQKRQREYLRQLIDANRNYIFTRDYDGNYTLVNKAMAEMTGIAVEDLEGTNVLDSTTLHSELKPYLEQDRKVIESGQGVFIAEEKMVSPVTGETRWVQAVKEPIPSPDRSETEVLVVLTDITERVRAERALRSLVEQTAGVVGEDFFRSLVKQLSHVYGTKHAMLSRIVVNNPDQLETLALWGPGGFIENMKYSVGCSPCEEVLKQGYLAVHDHARQAFPNDPDLVEFNVESYIGTTVFDMAGKPLGVLSVFHDQPQAEWSQAESLLKLFAARAGAELDRMRSAAQNAKLQKQLTQSQKMEAIGQLAAGVAHDLNNALGAVVGHLQLIRRAFKLEKEVESSVDIALSGCERAGSLIQQLLGFSRQGLYKLKETQLHSVLTDTLDFLSKIIGKELEIDIQQEQHELVVFIDQGQVQQALTNLIINAKQAMPDGGKLSFALTKEYFEDPSVYNRSAKPGEFARLTISDTGCGIEPDKLEKIFEPFFTTKPEGSGLGLSMVYGVMQNHKGWIDVQSEQNKGTTIKLYFPALARPAAKPDKPEVAEVVKSSGRVLVVDDEPFLVDLTLKFLEQHGLEGKGFTSAIEAVAWYADNFQEIDLIILDMKMPGISGKECFAKLREINPAAKVVILSGYIHDKDAQELMQQGALEFFQKPLKYPELMGWVTRTLAEAKVKS